MPNANKTETKERVQEKRAECATPAGSNKPESFDALRRLSKLYPNEIGKILSSGAADEWSSHMFGKMNGVMDRHGWTCIADTAEFLDRWQPGDNNASPQTRTPAGNSQKPADILVCIDRLQELCPKAFKEAKDGIDDTQFWPRVTQAIENKVSAKGYRLLAGIFEFMEAWKPGESADVLSESEQADDEGDDTAEATVNLTDIRKRVLRIGGLIQAAVLTGACFTNGGPENAYGDPADYFNAITGAVRAANGQLNDLLKLMDDTVQ